MTHYISTKIKFKRATVRLTCTRVDTATDNVVLDIPAAINLDEEAAMAILNDMLLNKNGGFTAVLYWKEETSDKGAVKISNVAWIKDEFEV